MKLKIIMIFELIIKSVIYNINLDQKKYFSVREPLIAALLSWVKSAWWKIIYRLQKSTFLEEDNPGCLHCGGSWTGYHNGANKYDLK